MAYSKTSKINLYKFVAVKEPSSSEEGGLDDPKAARALTTNVNNNTRAINNLGLTINSLANVLVDIKTINLERLNDQVDKKKKFKPLYGEPKDKKKAFSFFKKLGTGKAPSFLEGIMKLLGAALKWFVLLPTMKWLADPANQDKVVNILTGISKIVKFIFDLTKFGVTNTLDGLYDLLKDDATWWERLKGFGQAFIGLGTLFLGLRWLNPLAIGRTIGDFKGVLTFFRNNLKRSLKMMKARKMRMGRGMGGLVTTAATVAGGAYLFSQGRDDSALNQGLENVADKVPGLRADPETDIGKKTGDWLGGLIKGAGSWLSGLGKDKNKDQNQEATPKKKGLFGLGFLGLAAGGMVPHAAAGGWINGPQSGYPVSLDGRGVDFIGHGTEWVGRSQGGKAYVVPYDTKATRANPNLTSNRLDEAKRLGFSLPGMDEGGQFDFSKRLIKLHEGLRLNKYTDSKGLPTIGWGHAINKNSPFDIKSGKGITEKRANQLFSDDFNTAINFSKRIPGYGKAGKQQQIALHDLTYNMGANWHHGFPQFMDAFQKGDYQAAASELTNSDWFSQVGRRAPTIVSLMEGNGLGDGNYLSSLGEVPDKKGNWFSRALSGVGSFFGFGSKDSTGGSGSSSMFNEQIQGSDRDTSANVRQVSSPETGKGFQPGGMTDMLGRPIVLSRQAAESFGRMVNDSKNLVSGSDVKASGRSKSKNDKVGGHPNSAHLYGTAMDIHGKSADWIRKNGDQYGWKYLKGKGGKHQFQYVGPGSRSRTKLAPHGSTGGGFSWGMGKHGLLGPASSSSSIEKDSGARGGGGGGGSPAQISAQKREQKDLEKHSKARDYARREIMERTQEMMKQVMGQVNVSNSENRQAVSSATQLIQQLMGMSGGGSRTTRYIPGGGQGGGRGTESGFGAVLRTTATVLNSFNNPLRGLFK